MSAVKAWSKAGFPIKQMILGVPTYGHSFRVTPAHALNSSNNIMLYAPFNKSAQPTGDKWDATAGGVDECGNPNVVGGVFNFWGLVYGGFLTTNGNAASGIDYVFDNCSETVRTLSPFTNYPRSSLMSPFELSLSCTTPRRK
jgi:chitinase